MTTPEFRFKLVLDESELNAGFSRADARSTEFVKQLTEQAALSGQQVGRLAGSMQSASTGAFASAKKGLTGVADASKLTRQEMMALNYTASDVVASLSSGASPFTILLQQGGQVKDAFGGVGNLISKLASAISPMAVGIGAAAAGVGAFAFALYKGRQEQEAFNKALLLTGNYAGLTNDSLQKSSQAIAASTDATIGSAREMVVALANTGRVSAGALDPVAKAAAQFAKVTGQSSDQVAQHFAGMSGGVAKWAAESNKQYHFLSLSQYQYIKTLEEQGRADEAQRATSDALFKHFATKGVESLGLIEGAWQGAAKAASEYWERAKEIGRDDTLEKQIAVAQGNLALAVQAKTFSQNPGALADLRIKKAQEALDALTKKSEDVKAEAKDKAEKAALQERAIISAQNIERLADEAKGQSQLNRELEKYRKDLETIRQAGGQMPSQATQDAIVRRLTENNDPMVKVIQARKQALGQENAKLEEQIAYYEKYGKTMEQTARSALEFDLARGQLKGRTGADIEALRRDADRFDSNKAKDDQNKELERLDKKIDKLNAAANAQALSNREARIAQEIADIDTKKVPFGSSQYQAKAAGIASAVNADEDRLLASRLRDQSRTTQDEVDRLRQESEALGQNALQRQIAAYAVKLEADARKELLNSPDRADQINSAKTADLIKYTNAATEAYERQRDAVVGLRQAVNQYSEQAANGAQFAANFFKGATAKMEDAIVNFTKTGKLNLKDFFGFMADEFLRQQARMVISKAIGGGGDGGIAGLVTSLIGMAAGGGGAAKAGSGASLYSLSGSGVTGGGNGFVMPKFASGGDPYINRLNLVGERGPELFVPRVPGTIVPNNALGKLGSPTVQVIQHNQIGSTMGRAELDAGMTMAQQAAVSEVFDRLRRMGVMR